MLKKLIILAILILLLIPLPSQAQGVKNLAAVEVDLWPEFDRPEMLVIFRITLSASTSLPADLTVRIPTAAGAPNAVAAKQADGSLVTITYDSRPAGEWTELRFTAPSPELQIEYYDPGLKKDGAKRTYRFNWAGDYAVDDFTIIVQQPIDATRMIIAPSFGAGVEGSDGLLYYTNNPGTLKSGQQFTIDLSYLKESDTLSSSGLSVSPIDPIDNNTEGRNKIVPALPWVIGGLGFVLLVGAVIWYFSTNRRTTTLLAGARPRHKPASTSRTDTGRTTPEPPGSVTYCSQCGKRSAPGDRFCRTCGTQLR